MLINEQIDTMPAGAEMDALVAISLFGWSNLQWRDADHYVSPGCGRNSSSPAGYYGKGPNMECFLTHRYSTDIAAAWLVVEKLRDSDQLESIALGNWEDSRWTKWVVTLRCFADDQDGRGETAPLAICRAALKAAALATK